MIIRTDFNNVEILVGECRIGMEMFTDRSVQCCVTSPPYYGLRDYGADGQIGLEPTPDEYVAELVSVFRDVWRVLRDYGTLWLNLGDSYASGKQLLMIPARVALALQADGWILRSQIVWAKTNPMNEPCKDRPTSAWESVFLFSKQSKYFYDIDAIRLAPSGRRDPIRSFGATPSRNDGGRTYNLDALKGANARNVWPIAAQKYGGAHFATMPIDLAEQCIRAGSRIGDTILDPFGGAGTTACAAVGLGRNAILTELNPEYAALAATRIAESITPDRQSAIFAGLLA